MSSESFIQGKWILSHTIDLHGHKVSYDFEVEFNPNGTITVLDNSKLFIGAFTFGDEALTFVIANPNNNNRPPVLNESVTGYMQVGSILVNGANTTISGIASGTHVDGHAVNIKWSATNVLP